jgi:hypothetical protein
MNKKTGKSCAGLGIGGKFPVLASANMDPLVFQNCVEVDELITIMDGYLQFRLLQPEEVEGSPSDRPERLEDIDPSYLFHVNVAPVLFRLQPGQEFVPNPRFEPGMN